MSGCCWKCGDTATPVTLEKDGETLGTGELCDRCFDEALEGARLLRIEFDGLLAAGMSRSAANAAMIKKIDGLAVAA